MNSEEPVYEAVVDWVKYDPEERKSQLPRLLQHVRLPLLSAKYITDVLDKEVGKLLVALVAVTFLVLPVTWRCVALDLKKIWMGDLEAN